MTYYGDDSPEITATVITLAVISYVVFGLRVYVRIQNRAWGMDDWCMTASTVPFTALTISCLGSSYSGVGVHEFRLSAAEKTEGLKFFFFFEIFYCAAIIPIKLSISFMLIRIASGRRKFIQPLYAVSAAFTLMNLIALLYIVFRCSPVQYAWNTSIQGAVNITTDWFCAILPIPLLWNVQLNRNAKVSVGVILSLGALASLSACIRLIYTVNLTHSTDYISSISKIVVWGYAENGVGMIVACVATLRPLFRRILGLGGNPVLDHTASNQNMRCDGREENWVALCELNNADKVKRLPTEMRELDSEERVLRIEVR